MRYLEHFAISNKSPGPFSTYGQTPYKFARYLELRYLEPCFGSLEHISLAISNFS